MRRQPFKRRIFIVDTGFQFRLIRNISILAALIVLVSLSFLGAVNMIYSDVQVNIKQPLPFATTEGAGFLERQASLLGLMWPVMLICIAVSLAATFFFGVIISHRMAGPVFRIRRVLMDMAKGDIRGETHLRKNDEFKPLAESINEMKGKWRGSIQEMQSICRELDCDGDPGKRELFNRLFEILSSFKTA